MSGIKIIPPVIMPQFPQAGQATGITDEQSDNGSFGDLLKDAIGSVNDLQQDAAEAQDKMMTGEAADLHQVMIAVEKAGISFDLLLRIREELLEAYDEVISMPV